MCVCVCVCVLEMGSMAVVGGMTATTHTNLHTAHIPIHTTHTYSHVYCLRKYQCVCNTQRCVYYRRCVCICVCVRVCVGYVDHIDRFETSCAPPCLDDLPAMQRYWCLPYRMQSWNGTKDKVKQRESE
jgi:hypothetical protein